MLGGIATTLTGILFTLISSAGKPPAAAMFCYGTGRTGVRICLEGVTEDRQIRAGTVAVPIRDLTLAERESGHEGGRTN